MLADRKHKGVKGGGEVVTLLLQWRSVPGGGPSREGRGSKTENPFCQHTWHTRSNQGKERPEVSGMGKSPTPILSSDGHWGDPPFIQDLKAKGGTNLALPDLTSKASSLSTQGFHPTQTLLASTGIGTCTATTSAMWLYGSDGLPADTRAGGGGPWTDPGYHALWGGGGPGISMVSTSCIMRDEATGVTYMDTVTTSIGRVALSGLDSGALSLGPMIKDVTGHE